MARDWDQLPRTSSSSTADAVHLAVGRAITQWERSEWRICLIYTLLKKPGSLSLADVRLAGAMSSYDRLATTLALAKSALPTNALNKRLIKHLNRCIQFQPRRNEIAHGVVSNVKIDGTDLGQLLVPAYYNSKKFSKDGMTAAYLYGPAEIAYYQGHFATLAEEGDSIATEMAKLSRPVIAQS